MPGRVDGTQATPLKTPTYHNDKKTTSYNGSFPFFYHNAARDKNSKATVEGKSRQNSSRK